MKSIATIVVSLVLAGTAAAAPSPSQLQRQVKTLTRQVSSLQGRVDSLKDRVGSLESQLAGAQATLSTTAAGAICGDSLLWDGFDAIVLALGFDPGPPVDDLGACAAIGVTRDPPSARGVASGFTRIARERQHYARAVSRLR